MRDNNLKYFNSPRLYFTVFFSIILFIYHFYRAYNLSFIIDEAFTLRISSTSWKDLLIFRYGSPNEHLINNILIKLLAEWIGISEIILRIPSLLIYLLYMLGSYLLIKDSKHWLIFLFGWVG